MKKLLILISVCGLVAGIIIAGAVGIMGENNSTPTPIKQFEQKTIKDTKGYTPNDVFTFEGKTYQFCANCLNPCPVYKFSEFGTNSVSGAIWSVGPDTEGLPTHFAINCMDLLLATDKNTENPYGLIDDRNGRLYIYKNVDNQQFILYYVKDDIGHIINPIMY